MKRPFPGQPACKTPALLKGVVRCAHCDSAMGPTWSRKDGRTYRYYLCGGASRNGYGSCPVKTVAAGEIEDAVVGQLRAVFRAPELVARTFREAKTREAEEVERLRGEKADLDKRLRVLREASAASANGNGTRADLDEVTHRLDSVKADLRIFETNTVSESDVIDALERLDPVWEELFPAEQARIVQLLVEQVEVRADGLELRLRTDGLRSLVAELMPEPEGAQA